MTRGLRALALIAVGFTAPLALGFATSGTGGGTSGTPANMATTDTAQTVHAKEFYGQTVLDGGFAAYGPNYMSGNEVLDAGTWINFDGLGTAGGATLRATGNHALTCQKPTESWPTATCSIYAGNLYSASGVVALSNITARGTFLNDSGDAHISDTFKLGVNGTSTKDVISATATLDFPDNAATWGCDDLTLTVTNTATTNTPACQVGWVPDVADAVAYCWVSAANTVTVRVCSSGNPASATFRATVTEY